MIRLRTLVNTLVLAALGLHGVVSGVRAGGGPMTGLIGHTVFYAGFRDGRVFRSLDGGASWQEADRGLPAAAGGFVTSVATAGSVVYAADKYRLYRSTDQGRQWQPVQSLNKRSKTSVQTVLVSPLDARQVYVVDDGIVWRSADGGQSWMGVATYDSPDFINYQQDLALSPLNPSLLLMVGFDYLHRSTDGGRTWSTNQNAFASVPIPNGVAFHITSVAFDAQRPAVVYLATDLDNGLFRSTDGGWTWQRVRSRAFPSSNLGTTLLAADPIDGGQLLAVGNIGDSAATIDGGTTWTALPGIRPGGLVDAVVVDPNDHVHVLLATSTILDDDTLREDFYRSVDGGLQWQRLHTPIRSIVADDINKLTVLVATSVP